MTAPMADRAEMATEREALAHRLNDLLARWQTDSGSIGAAEMGDALTESIAALIEANVSAQARAIAAWNRRPSPPPEAPSGEREELSAPAGSAIISRIGWDKDDAGNEVFRAVLWFPNGPPDLPINTAWDLTPVYLSTTPPAATPADAGLERALRRVGALEAEVERLNRELTTTENHLNATLVNLSEAEEECASLRPEATQ